VLEDLSGIQGSILTQLSDRESEVTVGGFGELLFLIKICHAVPLIDAWSFLSSNGKSNAS